MAKVGITIGRAIDGFKNAYAGVPVISESITSSGSSQATTGTVPQVPDVAARITTSGGPIWVKTGSASPTAAAGDDYLIPDGGTLDIVFLEVGWKIAVIDA
jgi:hypothetical protein